MAEKQVALSVESKDSNSDDEGFTWTEEEEKALVRRYADSSPPIAAEISSYTRLRRIMLSNC